MSARGLVWVGVLGAPAAWTVQHITGYALTEVTCDERGWHVHMDPWTVVVTAVAVAVTIAAEAAAIATYRATRDASEPPGQRIHFLAVIGITIGPLFLALILMSGLGAVLLQACRQS